MATRNGLSARCQGDKTEVELARTAVQGRQRKGCSGCQEPKGWPLCYGSHLLSARFIAESPAGRALPDKRGLGLKLKSLFSEGEEEDEAAAGAGAEEAKRSCSKVTVSFRFLMPAVPTHGRCHFHSPKGRLL